MLRRQVSTRPEKIEAFFQQLTEMDTQFMAILEVCGFNDWWIERLRKWNCCEIVLIHPEKPSKKKTDRRDAHSLTPHMQEQDPRRDVSGCNRKTQKNVAIEPEKEP